MPKVYIEEHARAYQSMFINNGWTIVEAVWEADLLQLIGGADVSPSRYGEEKHPRTSSNEHHDITTGSLCDIALANHVPIAGICRGSQFLSVLGGGRLWQDVDGHATGLPHAIEDKITGEIINGCSSTHHQQHRPADNAIIIATAFPPLCSYKEHMLDGKQHRVSGEVELRQYGADVEAFFYADRRLLGYQPHPEFFDTSHPCQMYYFDLISRLLNLRGEICAD